MSYQFKSLLTKQRRSYFKIIPLLLLVFLAEASFGQEPIEVDSLQAPAFFRGGITLTNNGISTIPSFSLGKPAIIFNFSAGRKKLTFDPELRFALEGKPWTFLFWWRYKIIENEKFRIDIGAHPALSFRTSMIESNGEKSEEITAQRVLAGELSPQFALTNWISTGPYYFYSRGFERAETRHTHLLSWRSTIKMKLNSSLSLQVNPQLYYLKMDQQDGYYGSAGFSIQHRKLPFSLSTLVNKKIKSNILVGDELVWNLSLRYNFKSAF